MSNTHSHTTLSADDAAQKYAQVHCPIPLSHEQLCRLIAAGFRAGYNFACDRMAAHEREALTDEQR